MEIEDERALLELGRASHRIIHDVKNELNGLKLYATFLRKRMEKEGRPAEETETVSKLLAGLDRAAGEMQMLVRYGRAQALNRKEHTDLSRILVQALPGETFSAPEGFYEGAFDAQALAEALEFITQARDSSGNTEGGGARAVVLKRAGTGSASVAVIEWLGVKKGLEEPLASFAGITGLRLALAARIIQAHGGTLESEPELWRARLPLDTQF